MRLHEIERLRPDDYEGGRKYLKDKVAKLAQPLPGGSGFLWSTTPGRFGGTDIKIWDPKGKNKITGEANPVKHGHESDEEFNLRVKRWERDTGRLAPGQLIGNLNIEKIINFPMPGAVMVETITVDEDYRGQGIAKSLYGIVLSVMKLTLVAGDLQTPGGARNWVSLSQIPGVDIQGYVSLPIKMFNDGEEVEETVEILMGKLGAQYMGQVGRRHYFSFAVAPNTTGTELSELVKTKLSQVYTDEELPKKIGSSKTGLYAQWTGK